MTRSPRYRLGRLLGMGGMAEVFLGTLVGIEGFTRTVAIKRVLPNLSTMPRFVAMFAKEARMASNLAHPNVVSVFDFDRDQEGRLFLVMEYVDGMSLAELVRTGPVPPSVSAFIVSEALAGLGHAHNLPGGGGMIHRDVSPHNVLLSSDGSVKLADFGVAKAHDSMVASASAVPKGKTGYLSPEQLNGRDLDGRSDLFSIGIVLWELLSGRRLFVGSPGEVTTRVLFHSVLPPSAYRHDVPTDLEQVAMRLLARDPSERYATAALAALDLAQCKDAPRPGRSELTRLLAERSSRAEASSASLDPLRAKPPKERPEGISTVTEQPGARNASRAGWMGNRDPYLDWLEAVAARRRRRWRWGLGVLLVLVIVTVLMVLALASVTKDRFGRIINDLDRNDRRDFERAAHFIGLAATATQAASEAGDKLAVEPSARQRGA